MINQKFNDCLKPVLQDKVLLAKQPLQIPFYTKAVEQMDTILNQITKHNVVITGLPYKELDRLVYMLVSKNILSGKQFYYFDAFAYSNLPYTAQEEFLNYIRDGKKVIYTHYSGWVRVLDKLLAQENLNLILGSEDPIVGDSSISSLCEKINLDSSEMTEEEIHRYVVQNMEEYGKEYNLKYHVFSNAVLKVARAVMSQGKTPKTTSRPFLTRSQPKVQLIKIVDELLNKVGAKQINNEHGVTKRDLEEVGSWIAGKKLNLKEKTLMTMDIARMKNLADNLKKQVIDQDVAMDELANAVKRGAMNLNDEHRPLGVFGFFGPTGVGKTEAAKALAKEIFGDETKMIRYDMSEYSNYSSSSKLLGSAPGYIGFGQTETIVDKVNKNPESIILFDEIEKANPRIFDLLLQIFDDGRLTDAVGRTGDFTKTIIIMTSNLGASVLRNKVSVGFNRQNENELNHYAVEKNVEESMKKFFRPEFIARIDQNIVFNSLNEQSLLNICELLLKEEVNSLTKHGYQVEFDKAVVPFIVDRYSDPINGARPLKRGITVEITNRLANGLIDEKFSKEDKLIFVPNNNELEIKVIKNQTNGGWAAIKKKVMNDFSEM
ncbi:AAA family ATPase [Limosilactobacillus allomucosae]|uniref:AAA family ATPase n=1 Tax=Limosilactobacillus allomucosae TaxID=3142938 RepID=UPI0032654CFF